ncbi:MAG: hypothetical protein KTV72_04980, partial [Wolbachia endosymbiont of Melophagus ovinus]|nr:hypothetical protein [Wolbachia endosymbiont of Melophagus ovinus]
GYWDDRSTAIKLRKVGCYVFCPKQSTIVIFSNLLDFICLKIHHNYPITSNFLSDLNSSFLNLMAVMTGGGGAGMTGEGATEMTRRGCWDETILFSGYQLVST